MRIAHCGLLILLAVPCAVASPWQSESTAAQDGHQTDALAAAARRARAERQNQNKPVKVWDNDNIPKSGGIAVIGAASSQTANNAAGESEPVQKQSAAAKAENGNAKTKRADAEAELKSAKANLKTVETDLDFLKRKYKLDRQSFYQNPNYSSDASGAAALQDEQGQIDAKTQDVESARQKVAELQAQVAKSGGDSAATSTK